MKFSIFWFCSYSYPAIFETIESELTTLKGRIKEMVDKINAKMNKYEKNNNPVSAEINWCRKEILYQRCIINDYFYSFFHRLWYIVQ